MTEIVFSRGHTTLHLGLSVGPSVGLSIGPSIRRSVTFLQAEYALLLLPNRPRLGCRVSGNFYTIDKIISETSTDKKWLDFFHMVDEMDKGCS